MNPKEYFEANKDKIRETAEFLCAQETSNNIDEKFIELKNQYYNEDGTKHCATININGRNLDISVWLNEIRHEEIEHFKIIAITDKGNGVLFETKGTQTSSYLINLDVVDLHVVDFIKKNSITNMGLFVLHNHPFIYRATPSAADLKTLEALVKDTDVMECKAKICGMNCKISIIDFSIVTEFDYWSFMQSCGGT